MVFSDREVINRSLLQIGKFPKIIKLPDIKKWNLIGMVTHECFYKSVHKEITLIEENPEDASKLVLSFTS